MFGYTYITSVNVNFLIPVYPRPPLLQLTLSSPHSKPASNSHLSYQPRHHDPPQNNATVSAPATLLFSFLLAPTKVANF
jgi:hypothetical protein